MRVAMVIQAYRPVLGGAQRQVEQLAPLLQARGVDVHVVTRRPPGTPARHVEPGATVHRIPGTSGGTGAGAAYVAGAVAALARLRPDVIHAHDLLSPTSAALAAGAIVRAPVVTKLLSAGQNADVNRLLTKPFGRRRLALAGARVRAFVCLSEQVEEELRSHAIPDERMVRIPNGVDLEHFRPASDGERRAERERLGVGGSEPLVVYCGRFAEIKRVDVLLRAAAGAPVRVLLVGEGPEEDALRELAGDPALAGRVTIMSTVRDTAPVLRAADLYASASVTEGMSGAVLEAMASGLPVVASQASGMDELLGATTAMAADDSAEALRDVLVRGATDAGWRAAEGARLRRRAEAEFGLDVTADRLVALYRQVRGQPLPGGGR